MVGCGIIERLLTAPSFSGLGHCPLTAAARVRIPLGSRNSPLMTKSRGRILFFRLFSQVAVAAGANLGFLDACCGNE
jgi:hypothetical protein